MSTAIGKHYAHDYQGVRLDPYRILDVYGITHPAQQHAIKKLLRAGRGAKSLETDLREVIHSIERHLAMLTEDQAGPVVTPGQIVEGRKSYE